MEIGRSLREARLRQGIDITDVESVTKIRAKFLRSLENEEWEMVGDDTLVRSFLRTYADYLGLDPREISEQYAMRRPGAESVLAGPLRRERLDGQHSHLGRWGLGLALLAVAGLLLWIGGSH